jgi:hypothetical protein
MKSSQLHGEALLWWCEQQILYFAVNSTSIWATLTASLIQQHDDVD